MDDHIKGHRRSEDDEWTWQPPPRRRGIASWLAALAGKLPRRTSRRTLARVSPSWRPPSPRIPRLPRLPFRRAAELARRPATQGPRFREMLAAIAPFAAAWLLVTVAVLAARATSGGEQVFVMPIATTSRPAATPTPLASSGRSPTPSPAASPALTATSAPTPALTPSPAPPPAPPTQSHVAAPAPTPTPTSFPENQFGVAWWSRQSNIWVFGDLSQPSSGYHQGESVPFLARWPAGAGQNLQVSLVYDCATAVGPALDFVAGVQPGDDLPALTRPGPGRLRPDAAIPLPDDPSIAADDGNPGLLELWGGKFAFLAEGPAPATACPGQKSITFDVIASGGTMLLVGGVHLSSAAASQHAPYGLQVSVTSVGTLKVNIAGAP